VTVALRRTGALRPTTRLVTAIWDSYIVCLENIFLLVKWNFFPKENKMVLFSKGSPVLELTPSEWKTDHFVHPRLQDKKGLVLFGADWCPHCHHLVKPFESVAKTLGTSFALFYMDCAKYPEFAQKLNITGFPTVMYLDRKGIPYKEYKGQRNELGIINDICSEAAVCARR
jgi:thiol-disulfide isomerase/thioredoxin